ncbi:MAG: hypothetical protein GY874_01150 [Desulfobacteraceae bacterium]|nr:hypothetical protein [Desulfobacteraceae bacterium]
MMKKNSKKLFFFVMLLIITLLNTSLYAFNDPEQNKADYRKMAIENPSSSAAPILAFEGLDISDHYLDSLLASIVNDETGDFNLAQVIRILYFTDKYDEKILPVLSELNYWLTKGEDLYCYWSENHMILWMSAAYLMKQREGWQMDTALEQRLSHYLKLKIEYGFYEFFSSVYFTYSLAGLLNLADFAKDEQIRYEAEKAAKILMKNILLLTNDKGAYFPSAGRNYVSKYTSAYNHNHTTIIELVTGLAEPDTRAGYIGGFISTSSIDLADVANSWRNTLNTTLNFGHSQSDKLKVHAGFDRLDRTIFQWSSGGYFHPDTAADTSYTVNYYDLGKNKHLAIFGSATGFPDNWLDNLAKIGATFGRSSDISHATIDIFKNKGIVLTSLHNYYGGYFGWQQWPWAATIDDIAVWTQSGQVKENWRDRGGINANSHLPYIDQVDNVALILYWPNAEIRIADTFNQLDTSVALYWPADRFDDSFEYGKWIIGRKNDSYVAVYRDGTGVKNGHYYSEANRGRQAWAVVVGNVDMHHSFDNFVNVIKTSNYRINYSWDWSKWTMVYDVKLTVDGISISKRWW